MEQKETKRPKRRKSKDYPYELFIRDDKYFVSFPDANNHTVEVELTEAMYHEFDLFELQEKRQQNEWDRHIEHSEQKDSSIYRRKQEQTQSPEDQMLFQIEVESLRKTFQKAARFLTRSQWRRVRLRYYEDLSAEQIAELEQVDVSCIRKSIAKALIILEEHVEKDLKL